MYKIRPLKQDEYGQVTEIASIAFQEIELVTAEDKERFVERMIESDKTEEISILYGAFDGERLVGGMRNDDYTMRLLSQDIDLGGIGFVVVDFLHKKKGIAKALLSEFIASYDRRGFPMVALYPFRPDFYKKMGFGYGSSMNQYRVRPAAFPGTGKHPPMTYLGEADLDELIACYGRYRERTNGLFKKTAANFRRYLKNDSLRLVGWKSQGRLKGYMVFSFVAVDPHCSSGYDMKLTEWVYEDAETLQVFCDFLHSQKDQIKRVIVNTQNDDFHFLLEDPRNHHDNVFFPFFHEAQIRGTGIMYRVVNVDNLFRQLAGHDFAAQTLTVGLTLEDSFYPTQSGRYVIRFDAGHPMMVEGEADVELEMDISDFSSLITCSVSLSGLYALGRARVSDPGMMGHLERIFGTAPKPLCMNRF